MNHLNGETLDVKTFPAYYINLDTDLTKKKKTSKALSVYGFVSIKRVSGAMAANSMLGTSLAHLKALRLAKAPFVLIEDDIAINSYESIFVVPPRTDALYLGVMRFGQIENKTHHSGVVYQEDPDFEHICRVYNMFGAHAILVLSEKFRIALIEAIERAIRGNYPQDVGYGMIQKEYNVYATKNPIFYQNDINKEYQEFDTRLSIYECSVFVKEEFWYE